MLLIFWINIFPLEQRAILLECTFTSFYSENDHDDHYGIGLARVFPLRK